MIKDVWSNVVIFEALAGREKSLESALTQLTLRCRAEEGCLQYDCFQSFENPGRFLLQIRWRDAASLERHLASECLVEFFGLAGEWFRDNPERGYRAFSREG